MHYVNARNFKHDSIACNYIQFVWRCFFKTRQRRFDCKSSYFSFSFADGFANPDIGINFLVGLAARMGSYSFDCYSNLSSIICYLSI